MNQSKFEETKKPAQLKNRGWLTILAIALIISGFLLLFKGLPYSWWQQKFRIYPYAKNKKAINEGRSLYQVRCVGCHDIDFISFLRQYNKNHFIIPDYYHIITYGKKNMTGFGDRLSNDERWKIVSYIYNNFNQPSKAAANPSK